MSTDEAPLGRMAQIGVIGIWLLLLALFALFARESFVTADDLLIFILLLLCVVGSEWRWERRLLRQLAPFLQFMISAVALFWILSMFDTYSILRGSFPEGFEVTELPDGMGGVVTLSPFMSGAWTMRRAVDQQLSSACLPVFVLVVQVAASGIARMSKVDRGGVVHGA